jgi:hypothetical protein
VWKGGREEKLAGAALALAAFATPLLKDPRWLGPQWGVFAGDVAFLALIVTIAMRTRRWWPLCAAGFQLLGVLTHAARLIDDTVGSWAYATAGVIWSYAVLAAVAVGTIGSWRDERQSANAAPTRDGTPTRR